MNKVKLSGLWKNESKEGVKYLGGTNLQTNRRYSVFANGFKEKDEDPDYILYEINMDSGVGDDPLQ